MNCNNEKPKWPTATKQNPCPQCGHTDRCLVAPDGKAGKCWRDGGNVWRDGDGHAPDNGQSRPIGDGGKDKKSYATAVQAIEALERMTGGKRVADWAYRSADGGDVAKVVRLATPDGKAYRPIHRHKTGWRIGDPPGKWPVYRLNQLPAAGTVYVVEGEKCADLGADKLALAAVTSAHGSSAADKTDWTPLAGRDVVILPDNDEAGRKYADDVTRLLLALDPPATVRVVNLPNLPDAGDIEQFINGGGTTDQVRTLADRAEPIRVGYDWPDPRPLPSGLPPVDPFTYDLLPERLRPWVKDIAERMQCPPELVAVFVLASAGSLLGRKIAIRPKQKDDWQEIPNLWALGIGPPSMMKSPARRDALKTIYRLQVDARREYAAALEQYNARQLLGDADQKAGKAKLQALLKADKRAEAEALAEQLAAAGKQDEPSERVYVVNDCTVEALGVVLNQNPDGVLLDRDELIGWLRTMDRDGHENDRGFYLAAWGGLDSYEYRRIGRGTVFIESTTLGLVGTIQPGVYADYIRQAVAGGMGADGLSQRFQLAVWPDNPPDWQNIDRYPCADAKAMAHDALERLAKMTPADVQAERDDYERAIPFLRFDPNAQQVFNTWHADLMHHCRSGVEHPAMESHLLKMKSTVSALALIFHLLDGGKGPVVVDAIQRAVAWATFLASHARRIYAVVGSAPAMAARLLAKRIIDGDVEDRFTSRDIYNNGWAGLDRKQTETALDVLASAKWLNECTEPTGGRPKILYRINPKIFNSVEDRTCKTSKSPAEDPFDPFAGASSHENEKKTADAVSASDGRERGEI